MLVIKKHIKVDAPKCDKLCVTLAIPSLEQHDVLAAIKTLIANHYAGERKTRAYFLSANVALGINSYEAALLVQASPKKPNVSFLRFEFNPVKSDLAEVRSYLDWIIPNGGYKRLVHHGYCTRIDVAIDAHNVALDDLLVTHPGLQATRAYQKAGIPQTYELGSSQSARYFSIYDKRAQIKAHNSKAKVKQPIPQKPTTRIEARLKQRTPMIALGNVANPFAALSIADFSGVNGSDELTRLWLATSRCIGATAALQLLGPSRQAFTKRLEEASSSWWKPLELWKGWQSAAGLLTKPPPPAFDLSLLKAGAKAPLKIGVSP